MADATKIYMGPVTAIGFAAAATADGGSFTDFGYLDEDVAVNVEWDPNAVGLSDGNRVQKNGLGKITFVLVQTDPAGIQASIETYLTTLCKLKITTLDATNGYHFIDNIFLTYRALRPFKPGEYHRFEVTATRITEQPDNFCSGPKAAS